MNRPSVARRLSRPTPGVIRAPRIAQAIGTPDRFPPLQRVQIVELACLEPVADGVTLPTGTVRTWPDRRSRRHRPGDQRADRTPNLAQRRPATTPDPLLEDGSPGHPVQAAGREDPWCYANADRLVERGYWVVCADEIPNHQVLERDPIRRSIPARSTAGVRVHAAWDGQHLEHPDLPAGGCERYASRPRTRLIRSRSWRGFVAATATCEACT